MRQRMTSSVSNDALTNARSSLSSSSSSLHHITTSAIAIGDALTDTNTINIHHNHNHANTSPMSYDSHNHNDHDHESLLVPVASSHGSNGNGNANGDHGHHGGTKPNKLDRIAEYELDFNVGGKKGTPTVLSTMWRRFIVLCLLLLLQSISSWELQQYGELLARHLDVTLFLTMLVGAGGNASNQAAVAVIRGLATRELTLTSHRSIMELFRRELLSGLGVATLLTGVAFFRVYFFLPNGWGEDQSRVTVTIAICTSLFLIVIVSAVVGTALPLILHAAHIDPAHAGPAVQVVMDVGGVLITCVVCQSLLMTDA